MNDSLPGHNLDPDSRPLDQGLRAADMTSFPLPQELRDEVYSYLLNADQVQYTPIRKRTSHYKAYRYGGSAHTYHFHTNILSVNKTIAKDASEYLLKHNTFIRVNFTCSGFLRHCTIFDGPWPLEQKTYRGEHQVNSGSILMLAKDLPRLITLLKHYSEHVPPTAVQVLSKPDLPINLAVATTNDVVGPPRLHIKLQPLQSDSAMASIVRDLEELTVLGMDMALGGFDTLDRSTIQHKPLPSLIWLRSLQWNRFDTFTSLKQIADEHAKAGSYELALERYEAIRLWYIQILPPHAHPPELYVRPWQALADVAEARLRLARVEIALTAAQLYIRLGLPHAAARKLGVVESEEDLLVAQDLRDLSEVTKHLENQAYLLHLATPSGFVPGEELLSAAARQQVNKSSHKRMS
ncbi:hypothetical protein Slin15195_G062200 [Septoria linicola]|uniref:F-box domain-containing protein n=1 Tax=Septoria linicola TaxID=215465 RepID=A0A9Q9AYD3_9PEZI|nr:hypothetical protein Slin14017_G078010 [Septoria linicola]USW52901.1 hypothetical protein Slin15195_G062200 [Septoria linicola]